MKRWKDHDSPDVVTEEAQVQRGQGTRVASNGVQTFRLPFKGFPTQPLCSVPQTDADGKGRKTRHSPHPELLLFTSGVTVLRLSRLWPL